MANREDIEDRKLTVRLFAAIVIAIVVAGALLFLFGGPLIAEHLEPGLGLKASAVISFIVTLVVLVVMAVVAGEGLIGELQFMILGFAGFFLVLWLLIAWIF
ncbi:MAG: hypothetical protein GEU92_06670 [Alphaproteobacteria bacterium]|nr:hypothetical protein [Alphaproteobacteria bacterium]